MKKTNDYTGYSEQGIEEAIKNAMLKAGEHDDVEVIETIGAQDRMEQRQYQATVKAIKK